MKNPYKNGFQDVVAELSALEIRCRTAGLHVTARAINAAIRVAGHEQCDLISKHLGEKVSKESIETRARCVIET